LRSYSHGLGPSKAGDRELVPQHLLDGVQLPLGQQAEELQGDRVGPFAMDAADGNVGPKLARAR
jgi:hypothetical protein